MEDIKPREIEYPFIPTGRSIEYVTIDNPYMLHARRVAKEQSKDEAMPNASVIVKDNVVIGEGANGSDWHDNNPCVRVEKNIPSGQGYELCEGCHPNNHSEPTAIADANERGNNTQGADLYLWGHWWCCEPCWTAMDEAEIDTVYLLLNSEQLFNKSADNNIVGRQFSS